ncbi:MAG: hypothetical protein AAF773_03535 [Cyanobacteria bacterium P01_D01_bin.115]
MSQFQPGDQVRFAELALKFATTLTRKEAGVIEVELVMIEFEGREPLIYRARLPEKISEP